MVRAILKNTLLAIGSIFFFLITVEYLILHFFHPTDVARVEFKDNLIRYKANQTGIVRLGTEFSAKFSINENGWNSHHKKYSLNKNEKIRIAIIGDSYIAALEPGYKNAIPFLLEQELGPSNYEVYGFGIGGAHLAQYLNMFENEVLKYNPDLVIFLIIHNDFAPSYKKDLMASGRYGQTFLTLSIPDKGKVEEVNPKPYDNKWDTLLNFRLMRLIFYQYKLRTRLAYIKNLVLDEQYEMNIHSVANDKELTTNKILANYVVSNIMKIANKNGVKVLFMMNGDTETIYNGGDSKKVSAPLKLNKMMKKVVERNGVKFIDLHQSFKDDYSINHNKFEFETDGHWNPYGQSIATKSLIREITTS